MRGPQGPITAYTHRHRAKHKCMPHTKIHTRIHTSMLPFLPIHIQSQQACTDAAFDAAVPHCSLSQPACHRDVQPATADAAHRPHRPGRVPLRAMASGNITPLHICSKSKQWASCWLDVWPELPGGQTGQAMANRVLAAALLQAHHMTTLQPQSQQMLCPEQTAKTRSSCLGPKQAFLGFLPQPA